MSRVLVTGAAGAVGQVLLKELAAAGVEILASDIRKPDHMPSGISFETLDVRGDDAVRVVSGFKPEVIVHLASIVSPSRGMTREFAHDVDVTGTRKVVDAAIRHDVRRLVVTSSGAAYGYHADNPLPLRESDPVRGNGNFPTPITSGRPRRCWLRRAAHTRTLSRWSCGRARCSGPGLKTRSPNCFTGED